MFHASKFAGLSSGTLTIDEQGIDGTKSLKGVYAFYEDGGWQKDNLYLDARRDRAERRRINFTAFRLI